MAEVSQLDVGHQGNSSNCLVLYFFNTLMFSPECVSKVVILCHHVGMDYSVLIASLKDYLSHAVIMLGFPTGCSINVCDCHIKQNVIPLSHFPELSSAVQCW